MNHRQLGKFEIQRDLIENNPDSVAQIFMALKVVPVFAQGLFHQSAIEYIGISEQFRTLPLGEVVPEYELIIEIEDDGTITSVQAQELT